MAIEAAASAVGGDDDVGADAVFASLGARSSKMENGTAIVGPFQATYVDAVDRQGAVSAGEVEKKVIESSTAKSPGRRRKSE